MSNTYDWDDTVNVEDQTSGKFFSVIRMVFWDLVQDEKRAVLTVVAVICLMQIIVLLEPYMFKLILDYLYQTSDTTAFEVTALLYILLGMFSGVILFKIWLREYLYEVQVVKLVIRLENAWPVIAHAKLLSLSQLYHSRENTGKKVAKVNKAIEKMVQMYDDVFFYFLPGTIYIGTNLGIIMWLEWRLAVPMLLAIPCAVLINLYAYKKFYHVWDTWETLKEKSNGLFVQSIVNIPSVQGYVQESREAEAMRGVRGTMRDIDTDAILRMRKYRSSISFVLNVSYLTMLVYGIVLLTQHDISIGTVAYVFITGNATGQKIWDIMHVYRQILKHSVAAERLHQLFGETEVVPQCAFSKKPNTKKGDFEFENVWFAYSENRDPVLKSLNLKISKGKMVALVGRSGAGKSTVVSALTRVHDITKGVLTYGGIDVRTLDRDLYRGLFATVQQDVDIFDATIRENIAYAHPQASEKVVLAAVEAAYLQDVLENVEKFPDGLATQVGERGVLLSGGEQQRVGIARAYVALLCGAQVLVLDEATSNLDSESERAVQDFIDTIRSERDITIVAIAHRLSTIQRADCICVLDEGRIIEAGSHERLVEKNGLYAQLANLQQLGELRE